jgi:hypothetical protein
MKIKVGLVDGTEKEINIKPISGLRKNELLENATKLDYKDGKQHIRISMPMLENEIIKAVIDINEIKPEELTAESCAKISSEYGYLFGLDTKTDIKKK